MQNIPNRTNIILLEDSRQYIEGLQVMMTIQQRFSILEVFTCKNELLESRLVDMADVLLVDVEMPNVKALELGNNLKQKYPKLLLIALGSYKHDAYLNEISNAGYSSFLYKPNIADDLFSVLNNAVKNQIVI